MKAASLCAGSNVKAHKLRADAAKKVSTLQSKGRPVEKQLFKLGDEEVERMKKYFRTGFDIAQASKLDTDFKYLM